MLKEQFEAVLADFGGLVKQDLAFDGDNFTTFTVDDEVIVNLRYLPDADYVLAFAPVGRLAADDPSIGDKAIELLRLNEIGGPARGFTLALDENAELVLAMDRRDALELADVDALAGWMEALVAAVRDVRAQFANRFPEEEA